jgi:hypothetical protein
VHTPGKQNECKKKRQLLTPDQGNDIASGGQALEGGALRPEEVPNLQHGM